ncbi:MAG: hypothetical protein K6E54_01880, partial [Bacteroidaceae bacterium]|nr:hypothetical protein [Bacteroidaceae bacterium]
MKNFLLIIMSLMLAVYAWADDSTSGRNRYYGRLSLQRKIENYHLEDSIIGYPHIGIFWGVNWLFVVNKPDSSLVCYKGKTIASNELSPYIRQERSYSDSISAMFSLLDIRRKFITSNSLTLIANERRIWFIDNKQPI